MCAFLDSLDYARDALSLSRARTVLVGAVDALSLPLFLGFYKLDLLSRMTLGEGAVVVIIEELQSALDRGGRVYAEILGIGSCFEPGRFYKYQRSGKGMVRAIVLALKDEGLNPKEIDGIFTNANGTKDADETEAKAILEVFGREKKDIPTTTS